MNHTHLSKANLARLRAVYLFQTGQGPLPSYVDLRILEKGRHTRHMLFVYRKLDEWTEYLPGVRRRTIYHAFLRHDGRMALGLPE